MQRELEKLKEIIDIKERENTDIKEVMDCQNERISELNSELENLGEYFDIERIQLK